MARSREDLVNWSLKKAEENLRFTEDLLTKAKSIVMR